MQDYFSNPQPASYQELAVKGYEDKLKGFDESKYEEEEEKIAIRGDYVDTKLAQTSISQLMDRLDEGIDKILNNHDVRYVKALIDPFAAEIVGVRVPSLNPVDTYTHTQFDSFSLSN